MLSDPTHVLVRYEVSLWMSHESQVPGVRPLGMDLTLLSSLSKATRPWNYRLQSERRSGKMHFKALGCHCIVR
jgi:hypothetical protein